MADVDDAEEQRAREAMIRVISTDESSDNDDAGDESDDEFAPIEEEDLVMSTTLTLVQI